MWRSLKIALGGILAGLSGGLAAGVFVISAGEIYMPSRLKLYFVIGSLPYLLIFAAACGLMSGIVVALIELIIPKSFVFPVALIVSIGIGWFVHSAMSKNVTDADSRMFFLHFWLLAGALTGVAIFLAIRRLPNTDL
jgi:hypothetical protein